MSSSGTDITQNQNPTFSQAIKGAYTYPADWMYKYGPIIWFGVVPIVIGVIVFFVIKSQQRKREDRILMERSVDIEQ